MAQLLRETSVVLREVDTSNNELGKDQLKERLVKMGRLG
jgi:hypothetical protein